MDVSVGSVVSRSSANKAGKVLRTAVQPDVAQSQEYRAATATAKQWRTQHIEATQRCFSVLLKYASSVTDSVCTYRLKRLSSIIRKLQRPHSHLNLGELDDIGGCRLIVDCNDQVSQIAQSVKKDIPLKNGDGEKNYIAHPQQSGYRSHHLLAKLSTGCGSYQVEIQIRTKLQHYWSTAVEAAGEIYGTEYKSPETWKHISGDDRERIRFFQIISSLFALEEHTPQVPGFEGDHESLIQQLRSLNCSMQIIDDLQASTDSVFPDVPPVRAGEVLFLLKLSREDQYLDIESFNKDQLNDALARYGFFEDLIEVSSKEATKRQEEGPYNNVVLVYARNPNQLKVAYPNYSTNVDQFVAKVQKYLNVN